MNEKHTPAPWIINGFRATPFMSYIEHHHEDGNEWDWICSVWTTQADARLIAAAPDLLEALKNAVEYIYACYGVNRKPADEDTKEWREIIYKVHGG